MPTDILLDQRNGNWLQLDAAAVHVRAADLMLDHPQRRKPGRSKPHRRALVHDADDGLTINFNNDYPGGVTINGVTRIAPARPPAQRRGTIGQALGRRYPELLVEGGIRFTWHAPRLTLVLQQSEPDRTVSLQGLLEEMQARIDALEARVQSLEQR